jgi:Carboxypeptidase regulatory-like domain
MMLALVRRAAIGCWMLLMPLAAPGYAQETTGTILGALVDQTGAVLPRVKVVITSVDTGRIREVVTNNAGQYSASLQVGNYEISFLLPNFQPFTARGISLHVNDRLQVNGKLVAGAVETLTVTAERLVQPTATVQYLVSRTAVQELPLLNRTFVQLATLVPGVSSDLFENLCFCAPEDLGSALATTINGGRWSAVNWLLDGASNVNVRTNHSLLAAPSLESIQEINVLTSSYAAEWPRNGGGVVNVVTRSGTSRFSGSAYEFLRNDALNANNFFRNMSTDPETNSAASRLRYNNFGYTLGGPALPGRQKLFFFFSEEWRKSSRAVNEFEESVPDPAWLTDPTNPNYVPPQDRDPNAVRLLALWPAPNVPGTNLRRASYPVKINSRQEFVRADYHQGANLALTGRYYHDSPSADSGCNYPELEPNLIRTLGNVAVVELRRVGSRFVNELSYKWSGRSTSQKNELRTRSGLGVVIPEIFPENEGNLVPNVAIQGLMGFGKRQPDVPRYGNHTLGDTMTIQQGRHAVKAGVQVGFEKVDSGGTLGQTQGHFNFRPGGGFTAFQNFLRGNSDRVCGDRCMYYEQETDILNRLRFRRYEAFVQDTWRVHPSVTLDLGLRYAFYPPLTDEANMLSNFSPEAYDPARVPAFAYPFRPNEPVLVVGTGDIFNGIYVAGEDSPYGRAIYSADTNNLQPRLGIAWDSLGNGRLILRAGYGVYFDQAQVEIFMHNALASWGPVLSQSSEINLRNAPLSNPGAGTALNVDSFGVPLPVVYAVSDPFVAPRWQHWNVGLQRRLYSRGVADVGYVAAQGDHLLRFVDINKPQPEDLVAHGGIEDLARPYLGLGPIFMRETSGFSRYHGLLASFRHEGGRAGSATVNYTFSRNRADATYDSSYGDDPQNPLDRDAEFADARTDRRHILTAYYVYELPFARAATGGWRKALLGGWQIAGLTTVESGPAARVWVYTFESPSRRANQVSNPGAGDQSGAQWFEPAAFQPEPSGGYGNAPVAPFRLPGRHQWDFSVSKNLTLAGAARLQIRADVINAFNQTQFLDVETECFLFQNETTCSGSSGFLGEFGTANWARPPREIQLGIRLNW